MLRLPFLALLFATAVPFALTQESGDAPLGDVARSFRKKPTASETIIDNDNFTRAVDDASSRRAAGASPVFTLDAAPKLSHPTPPDATCNLSYTAKTTSVLSDPLLLNELPRSELSKLDGPAVIDGDFLQVSMHNGTSWDLREVVIGLTIVKRSDADNAVSYYGRPRIIPVAAGGALVTQEMAQKQPDVTLLLRIKGSAAPLTTAVFRTSLNFALFPDQEWHWAIVKAKGIPPPVSEAIVSHLDSNTTNLSAEAAHALGQQTATPTAAESVPLLPNPAELPH